MAVVGTIVIMITMSIETTVEGKRIMTGTITVATKGILETTGITTAIVATTIATLVSVSVRRTYAGGIEIVRTMHGEDSKIAMRLT